MSEQQFCDQCENQCPEEDLQCGRGHRRFGKEPQRGPGRREIPEGPIGTLMRCGHILHMGDVEGEDLLSALSADEQAELDRMLGVLLADWKERIPPEKRGRRPGGPGGPGGPGRRGPGGHHGGPGGRGPDRPEKKQE